MERRAGQRGVTQPSLLRPLDSAPFDDAQDKRGRQGFPLRRATGDRSEPEAAPPYNYAASEETAPKEGGHPFESLPSTSLGVNRVNKGRPYGCSPLDVARGKRDVAAPLGP